MYQMVHRRALRRHFYTCDGNNDEDGRIVVQTFLPGNISFPSLLLTPCHVVAKPLPAVSTLLLIFLKIFLKQQLGSSVNFKLLVRLCSTGYIQVYYVTRLCCIESHLLKKEDDSISVADLHNRNIFKLATAVLPFAMNNAITLVAQGTC